MTATEKRAEAVRLMKSRAQKNSYTQGSNRIYFFGKPDGAAKGYSDCSQAVQKAIYRATNGVVNIGANTDAQVRNRAKGKVIEMNVGNYPTESLLLPGDAIYFKGNSSHIYDVGHVEMYTGPNECYGHGSGTGPTKKNLKKYCKSRAGNRGYLCAIRWILGDDAPTKLGDRLLQAGCVGDDVKELQNALISLDYQLPEYGADGDYGNETKAAVRAFETDKGLPADGIADIECINAIVNAAGITLGTVYVTGNSVNIRKEPSSASKVLGIAYKNDDFQRTGNDTEDWWGIVYNGTPAYITKKYTTANEPDEPTSPDTQIPEQDPSEQVPSVSTKPNSKAVIVDLSQHNNLTSAKIDWAKVAENVDLLILRCGVTRTETKPLGIGKDDDFAYAAQKCIENGIPFGTYYYGKVKTAAEARKEAQKAFEIASPFNPIFYAYDVEESRLTRAVVEAFYDELQKLGVSRTLIYISQALYRKMVINGGMDINSLVDDLPWIPRYGNNDGTYKSKYDPIYPFGIHQYTSVGSIPGIADKTLDVNRLSDAAKPLSWYQGKE